VLGRPSMDYRQASLLSGLGASTKSARAEDVTEGLEAEQVPDAGGRVAWERAAGRRVSATDWRYTAGSGAPARPAKARRISAKVRPELTPIPPAVVRHRHPLPGCPEDGRSVGPGPLASQLLPTDEIMEDLVGLENVSGLVQGVGEARVIAPPVPAPLRQQPPVARRDVDRAATSLVGPHPHPHGRIGPGVGRAHEPEPRRRLARGTEQRRGSPPQPRVCDPGSSFLSGGRHGPVCLVMPGRCRVSAGSPWSERGGNPKRTDDQKDHEGPEPASAANDCGGVWRPIHLTPPSDRPNGDVQVGAYPQKRVGGLPITQAGDYGAERKRESPISAARCGSRIASATASASQTGPTSCTRRISAPLA